MIIVMIIMITMTVRMIMMIIRRHHIMRIIIRAYLRNRRNVRQRQIKTLATGPKIRRQSIM